MKVFVTKYALSGGIIEAEVTSGPDNYGWIGYDHDGLRTYISPNQFVSTKEEAIQKAEKMRSAKIKSLTSQIEKLKQLKFD